MEERKRYRPGVPRGNAEKPKTYLVSGNQFCLQLINAEKWYNQELSRLQAEGYKEVAPGLFEKDNVSVWFG